MTPTPWPSARTGRVHRVHRRRIEGRAPEIEDQWQVKLEGEVNTVTPILEKYDFDQAAMMEQGTPEEEAAFEAPPEVQAAQHDILTYESEVCGAQQPQPADVSYDGEEPGPYCELVAAQDERNAAALASGDPAEVEAFVDELAEAAAELIDGGARASSRTTSSVWWRGTTRAAARRARAPRVGLPNGVLARAPRRSEPTSTTPTRRSATSSPG